jgi:hypothetical protein
MGEVERWDPPTYICARRVLETAAFWAILGADHSEAPLELQALSVGAGSVPCRAPGATAALAWAKSRPGWCVTSEPVWLASEPTDEYRVDSRPADEAAIRAEKRAQANSSGIGAAFLHRPVDDDARGWRGLVVISDRRTILTAPVYARGQSPHATPDPDGLAILVETLIADQRTTLEAAVAAVSPGGSGIAIETWDTVHPVFA